MESKTEILTEEVYNKYKHDDRFLHEITFAHGVQGREPDNKALCFYGIAKSDFKVSPGLQNRAKEDYQKRKEEITKSINNKLVFVGMGMDFTPKDKDHIGNYRIRTYIQNDEGVICFVEFGSGKTRDFLRCDHAIMHTKKDFSEWKYAGERDQTEKRIKELEDIRGNYNPYTKQEILNLVNKWFNCSFTEIEVYDYCLNTDDYISVSKKE